MLANIEIIEALASQLPDKTAFPIILDPVISATSGDTLLNSEALSSFREMLFPLSTLITPNLGEAALLLGFDSILPRMRHFIFLTLVLKQF